MGEYSARRGQAKFFQAHLCLFRCLWLELEGDYMDVLHGQGVDVDGRSRENRSVEQKIFDPSPSLVISNPHLLKATPLRSS